MNGPAMWMEHLLLAGGPGVGEARSRLSGGSCLGSANLGEA